MRDLLKPTITLFGVCLAVTLILAFTQSVTKEAIDQRAAIDAENARKTVLASAESFEKIEGIDEKIQSDEKFSPIKEAYKGIKGGSFAGYVFITETKGYGGSMEITVGLDEKGALTGVNIGANTETPGLGSKSKDAPFITQFKDFVPAEALKVIKGKKSKPEEVEAISGATITSAAVTKAVQAAVDMDAELSKGEGTK